MSGSGSGSQLNFPHASTENVVGAKLETKFCEGYCGGRTFYRPVGSALKFCTKCEAQRERIRRVN